MFTIGADLGASKLSLILTDSRGKILRHAWVPHTIRGVTDILDTFDIAAHALQLKPLIDEGLIRALGVSCAGWVSPDQSTLIASAILGVDNVPLVDLLRSRFRGIPVVLENDGDATLWAEYVYGAARGVKNAMLFTIGTGVGGGLIIDGRLVRGAHGFGTEFGHMPVPAAAGRLCVCGNVGCLEMVAGGRSLQQTALRLRETRESEYLSHAPTDTPTARELGEAASAGDPAALLELGRAATALADAIAVLIPALDPQIVVIGGSVTQGIGHWLLPAIEKRLETIAFLRQRRGIPPIVPAQLGALAAVRGAADFAMRAVSVRVDAVTAPA
jgi:glucokinase